MKLSTKITRACLCLSMVLAMLSVNAFAVEPSSGESGGSPPVKQMMEVPVSQTEANINGRQVLTKVFEVSPDTDPESLKEYGLVIGGYEYTLSSFTKETTTKEDSKSVSKEQTIALKSSNKNDAYLEALKTFSQTIDFNEDGYAGELNLVAATIEVSETGRSTQKASDVQTKRYTFDYNDDSLVPATLTVNGKTYNRTSVSWSDGAYGPDGVMPENYVATARYARSWTYSSVDGYQATATYAGTASLSNSSMVRYTVEYIGSPVSSEKGGLFSGLTGRASSSGVVGSEASSLTGVLIMMFLLFVMMMLFVVLVATGKIKFDFASAKSNNIVSAGAQGEIASESQASSEGTDA